MMIRTLLTLLITCNALSTHNCLSMEPEKKNEIIILNNGLLTKVPAKIIKENRKVNFKGWGSAKIVETIDETDDTLRKLWHLGTFTIGNNIQILHFYPLIVEVIFQPQNIYIHNLGELNRYKKHHEAKEAIRERKALYSTYKQGVVIYSIDKQPDPSIAEHVERMLDENKKQMTISQ